MDIKSLISETLEASVFIVSGSGAPPKIAEAIHYGVFPGGARIRPRLCLAVAMAYGQKSLEATLAAAAAIELLHCASLVHDDLPCFDDADVRRGKPSVHRAFGEEIAVLAGDAMIVLAFQTLARGAAERPEIIAGLLDVVARSVGMPFGIIAGQAWESEPDPDLKQYHQAKTGSLFVAAVEAGALTATGDATGWRQLGVSLGEAYQVADDLRDLATSDVDYGKSCGRDAALGRPSAANELGVEGAVARFRHLIADGLDSIPSCPGRMELQAMIDAETRRFVPKSLAHLAA
ncbi:MAG: polyprenyl synthetase family protein [Pseudomonadota bacterium]